MVFSQKSTDKIIASDISDSIKTELLSSKVYMESRVLCLDITDCYKINDLKKLVLIKISK